jgi:phospholipid transport system transporter-binding protein
MTTLHLPARLTQREADACLAQLTRELPATGCVSLDARALDQFDSSALAVLLACQRAAQARGCTLEVVGLPPKAQQLAQVYGVAPWLQRSAQG